MALEDGCQADGGDGVATSGRLGTWGTAGGVIMDRGDRGGAPAAHGRARLGFFADATTVSGISSWGSSRSW